MIAPDSINTLPEATIKAFKDHGQAKTTITDGLKEAEKLLPELKSMGIDIREVTDQLEKEGVQLFSDSFFALLKEIAIKRDLFLSKK